MNTLTLGRLIASTALVKSDDSDNLFFNMRKTLKDTARAIILSTVISWASTGVSQSTAGAPTNNLFNVAGLNVEQTTKLRSLTQNLPEMTDLMAKLSAAQKEAIQAALGGESTEIALREKLEKVAKLQVEIAMIRYNKGIKQLAPTISEGKKQELLQMPGFAYSQLFVGSTAGNLFPNRARFIPEVHH